MHHYDLCKTITKELPIGPVLTLTYFQFFFCARIWQLMSILAMVDQAKNRLSVAVNDKELNNANKMSTHDTEAKILPGKEDIEPPQALIRKQTESSTKKRNRAYSQKNQNYTLYDSATHNKNHSTATKCQEHLQQDTHNYDIQQGVSTFTIP